MSGEDLDEGGSEAPNIDARSAATVEADAKLDSAVREAADKVFSRRDAAVRGGSMDDTMRSVYDSINSPERAETDFWTAPSLPKGWAGKGIDEAVEATSDWLGTPLEQRQAISGAAREIESLKKLAEDFGLELKTPADLATLQKLTGKDEGRAEAPAPAHEIWGKMGVSAKSDNEAVQSIVKDVERRGATGMRDVLDKLNWHPYDLLRPEEQAAGGPLGQVLSEYQDCFARAGGLPPHHAIASLLHVERMLDENPEGTLHQIAEQYGVNITTTATVCEAVVDAISAFCPDFEKLQGEVADELGSGRHNDNDNPGRVLIAAYKAAAERRQRDARRSPREKSNRRITKNVKAAAAEVYS